MQLFFSYYTFIYIIIILFHIFIVGIYKHIFLNTTYFILEMDFTISYLLNYTRKEVNNEL